MRSAKVRASVNADMSIDPSSLRFCSGASFITLAVAGATRSEDDRLAGRSQNPSAAWNASFPTSQRTPPLLDERGATRPRGDSPRTAIGEHRSGRTQPWQTGTMVTNIEQMYHLSTALKSLPSRYGPLSPPSQIHLSLLGRPGPCRKRGHYHLSLPLTRPKHRRPVYRRRQDRRPNLTEVGLRQRK